MFRAFLISQVIKIAPLVKKVNELCGMVRFFLLIKLHWEGSAWNLQLFLIGPKTKNKHIGNNTNLGSTALSSFKENKTVLYLIIKDNIVN